MYDSFSIYTSYIECTDGSWYHCGRADRGAAGSDKSIRFEAVRPTPERSGLPERERSGRPPHRDPKSSRLEARKRAERALGRRCRNRSGSDERREVFLPRGKEASRTGAE